MSAAFGVSAAIGMARGRLRNAQHNGLDRIVWSISGWASGAYPERERGFIDRLLGRNDEFKQSSEMAQTYISRLAHEGSAVSLDNHLYLIKGSIGLAFALQELPVVTRKAHVDSGFGSCGNVDFRYHQSNLTYCDWNHSRKWLLENGVTHTAPDDVVYT